MTRKRYSTCQTWRRVTVRHLTLSLVGGGMHDTGKREDRIERCGAPLFSPDECSRGTCRSCESGWEVEGNRRHHVYCIRCGEQLDPDKAVSLELDMLTDRYEKPGTVPEDRSQGVFTFGRTCARKANEI